MSYSDDDGYSNGSFSNDYEDDKQVTPPSSNGYTHTDPTSEEAVQHSVTVAASTDVSTIQVHARVRPFLADEERKLAVRSKDATVVTKIEDKGTEKFTFDDVYWSCDVEDPEKAPSHQAEIFSTIGQPLVDHLMEGKSGCFVAYGCQGSGKSYTVFGPEEENEEAETDESGLSVDAGLLPRMINALVTTAPEDHEIYLGFLRVNGEHIYDLLNEMSEVQVRPAGDSYGLRGIKPTRITSIDELKPLVAEARSRLNEPLPVVEPDHMVSIMREFAPLAPGRSHLLGVIYSRPNPDAPLARVIVCDLVQAEKLQTDVGITHDQVKKIRTSMLSLGICLEDSVKHARRHFVHRHTTSKDGAATRNHFLDCTLTKILKGCMWGPDALAYLICTVAPSLADSQRSTYALKFASEVKRYKKHTSIGESLPESEEVDALIANYLQCKKKRIAKGKGVVELQTQRKHVYDQRKLQKEETTARSELVQKAKAAFVVIQRAEFSSQFDSALNMRDAEREQKRTAHINDDDFEKKGSHVPKLPPLHTKKASPSPKKKEPSPPPKRKADKLPQITPRKPKEEKKVDSGEKKKKKKAEKPKKEEPEESVDDEPPIDEDEKVEEEPPVEEEKEPEEEEKPATPPPDPTPPKVKKPKAVHESPKTKRDKKEKAAAPAPKNKTPSKPAKAPAAPKKAAPTSASPKKTLSTSAAVTKKKKDGTSTAPPPVKKSKKIDWSAVAAKLPTEKTQRETDKRRELFNEFDPNGNGYLSLAEVDKGIRDVLVLKEVFNIKPVIMRAFQVSKDVKSKKKSAGSLGPDYVEWHEFRLLLVYLRQYFEIWQMFDVVDSTDDRRVELAEFEQAVPEIEKWGVTIEDPEAAFNEIDQNGGGVVLFDEFADWALRKHLDLEDDDDFDFDGNLAASGAVYNDGDGLVEQPKKKKGGKKKDATDEEKEVESKPTIDWTAIAGKLPTTKEGSDVESRRALFRKFDPNGNGYLSLAEVDKGIRDELELQNVFDTKPVIMRAFQAAKNRVSTKSKHGDDYVEWPEFRLLLCYLRQYFEIWQMFDVVDSTDDRRVELAEFEQAVPEIEKWGVTIEDPETAFNEIDQNGGGVVLFDEFADWALRKQLDLEDDDDFDFDVNHEAGSGLVKEQPKKKKAKKTNDATDDDTIAALFAEYDRNGNGRIERKELPRLLVDLKEKLGSDFSGKNGYDLFKELDRDQDGTVDADEFRVLFTSGNYDDKTGGDPFSKPTIDWTAIAGKLPTTKEGSDVESRRALFRKFDPNGNGYLSLAEVDKGIRDELELQNVFDTKPVIMRAFQAAKNRVSTKSKHGDDYVEWPEFRLLLCYLRQYFEIWQMFDVVDSTDDRRVELAEFEQAVPEIEKWGVTIEDPETAFNEIDQNGGGVVLFDEFADWALRKHLDLEDDDDFDFEVANNSGNIDALLA